MAGAEIIGQLLASEVTQQKKRRSAENEVREEEVQDENRYSRVSNKKRLAKLTERAARQENNRKDETADPKNIKNWGPENYLLLSKAKVCTFLIELSYVRVTLFLICCR